MSLSCNIILKSCL